MNSFKKLLGFVFIFMVVVVTLCPYAFAQDLSSIKINNVTLSFNKIVYIDATNGNDITGNGTNNNPFANIRKALDYLCDNNYKDNVAIVMGNGDYNWTPIVAGASYNIDNKYNKMKISFIPKSLGKVYLHSDRGLELGVVENDSSSRIKLCFYGIVFHNINNDYVCLAMDDWENEFYNCVFDGIYNIGGWKEVVENSSVKLVNCIFNNVTVSSLYTSHPILGEATNCASTNNILEPNNGTKITCLTNATLDKTYNITSNGWKNKGTGTNPDGSVANIGVYGGTYAWNYVATPKATNQLKLVLEVNEEKQLSISNELSDNTEMTWTSSDSTIATADENGKVKALKPGNTVITCTGEDYTESINVLVVDLEYQLAVDLSIGDSCRLTVDDLANTTKVTWSSYDPTIATVSAKGKVAAISEGLTYIVASDKDGNEIGRIYIRVRK